MNLPPLSPEEFLFGIVLLGLALLLCVYIPVKCAARWRRIQAERTRLSCRICGYRFLRADAECHCPHCGARNR